MVTPGFVKFALMLAAFVVVFSLGKAARRSTPDNTHFGAFYNWFVIALVLFVLAISEMPYVSVITKTFAESIDFVSVSIADKFNKQKPLITAAPTTLPGVVLPTTRPTDFVEWVSTTQIQPKAGATLPFGWRVSYSDGTAFGVVDKPISVDAAKTISVYWDPDTSVYPGQSPLPVEVLPGRP